MTSRYNLRSTCFEPCPSLQVSEEIVDDGHVTALRVTLSQPIETVNRLPVVNKFDPSLHDASGVERVASGLDKDASETNMSASESGHEKTHVVRAYGKRRNWGSPKWFSSL
ncbi:hypothetical protein O6H91_23G024600 [Diphasiastrum complanatum]|uniref:Uncharacterized protein n=1 Tax=Diphasiastrum complanatum TaxID=34168 RepID=A0ACC2A961_DIPCM|nr:hypothetical protein O6H91_23G024600 [Diphasiastrum complanatum]